MNDLFNAADLAKNFAPAKLPAVGGILENLVAMGRARKTDGGKFKI